MVWSMQKKWQTFLILFLASIYCTNQLKKQWQVQLTPDNYIVWILQKSYLNTCSKLSLLLLFFLKWCPDSMMFTTACVHATCRSTVHTHIFRWLAALRHRATSPLFPVYNVWGFLFWVSLRWLILWFCRDALDRPCAKMKHWSLLILCNNLMLLDFAGWVFFHCHYFLSSFAIGLKK